MGSKRKKQEEDLTYSQVEIDRRAGHDPATYRGEPPGPSDYPRGSDQPRPWSGVRETALVDRPAAERFPPLIEYTMNKLRHNLFALDDHAREIRQLRTGTRQVLARLGAAA